MADDDITRRLGYLERAINNGRFVRTDTYEAGQRAQERTDLEQERRYSELREDVAKDIEAVRAKAESDAKAIREHDVARVEKSLQENRDSTQWLQRQLIIMLLGILSVAAIAGIALQAAQ